MALVLTMGDRKGTALPIGVAGLVVLAVIQMVVLRQRVFSPCTIADVVGRAAEIIDQNEEQRSDQKAGAGAGASVTVVPWGLRRQGP